METEKLKPCPFCGGENLQFRMSDIEGWVAHVECLDCDDMLGPMSEYKYEDQEEAQEDATTVWNRRTPDPAVNVGAASGSISICKSAARHMVDKKMQWHIDPQHILNVCDAAETEANLWRFWNDKARELAAKNTKLIDLIRRNWCGDYWRAVSDNHAEEVRSVLMNPPQSGKAGAETPAVQPPPPSTDVVGMDEEDRTPVPEGFNAAQWQRADEVHHAMALVADDAECVKILYAALAATEGSAT